METAAELALAPEWAASVVPWLVALVVLATGAAAVGIWMLVARVRALEKRAQRFDALDAIAAQLAQLVQDRSDLDLRRIEHVLIEMRDGQKRLEEVLMRTTQAGARAAEPVVAHGADGAGVSERIIQRLLAHGYERVHVVPSLDELAQQLRGEGVHEVLVEARQNGVMCKGRVLVRDGAVTDVELEPAYTMFP